MSYHVTRSRLVPSKKYDGQLSILALRFVLHSPSEHSDCFTSLLSGAKIGVYYMCGNNTNQIDPTLTLSHLFPFDRIIKDRGNGENN